MLNELGQKISLALSRIQTAETIDDALLDACLKDICTALLQADVRAQYVMNLRTNVKTRANSASKGAGLDKRKIIEKAVIDELCAMLDSGVQSASFISEAFNHLSAHQTVMSKQEEPGPETHTWLLLRLWGASL